MNVRLSVVGGLVRTGEVRVAIGMVEHLGASVGIAMGRIPEDLLLDIRRDPGKLHEYL
jgi:hypothetical protein